MEILGSGGLSAEETQDLRGFVVDCEVHRGNGPQDGLGDWYDLKGAKGGDADHRDDRDRESARGAQAGAGQERGAGNGKR